MNPLFNNDWLITDTGAVDHAFIAESAKERAKSQYGADCTADDVAFWVQKLTGMAEVKAEQFRLAANAAATIQPSVAHKVPARNLLNGDRVGSGEIVIQVAAGLKTPRGKVEVTLERNGARRMAIWNASTVITVRRAA